MVNFENELLDKFLATVRKYMQLRGGLNQKDLAEKTGVGISTMSRLLNKKVKDLDGQVIANIVASLDIPLHEIIDFINEDSETAFVGLVNYYKNIYGNPDKASGTSSERGDSVGIEDEAEELESIGESLESTRARTTATIKGVKMSFGERAGTNEGNKLSIRDKLNNLSPRQKGFLTDFLDLDGEGRDLVVDIGNSLFRFFKQKNVDF